VARDAAGNTTTSSALTVNVSNTVADATAPTVSMTAPGNGSTVSGSAVGAVLGAFIFGMTTQGIIYAGWNPDWFKFFVGALLLIPFTPAVDHVARAPNERPSVLLAADGSTIATYRRVNREWIPLQRVPQHVVDALIATEDHTIPPPAQRAMSERAGATVAVPTYGSGTGWALRELVILHELAHHLADDGEVAHGELPDMVVTESMHARKQRMFELADAFVTLPGGIGTYDETIEIITWAQLGLHRKPILICDVAGAARPFLAAIDAAIAADFTGPEVRQLFEVLDGAAAVLQRLAHLHRAARGEVTRL